MFSDHKFQCLYSKNEKNEEEKEMWKYYTSEMLLGFCYRILWSTYVGGYLY